jgi:SAM-dependent methyltransferase
MLMKRVAKSIRRLTKPAGFYQDFYIGEQHYPGSKNTTAQFHALDIAHKILGKSFLDLGSNVGGLVFLAEQAGAARSVGVELSAPLHRVALEIKTRHGMKSDFVLADITAYAPPEQFDFVTCMAVGRHIFAQIVRRHVPEFLQPTRFLENDPMDVLVRHRGPFPAAAYADWDAALVQMIGLARQQFIFSIRDQSGVMIRRGTEIAGYLRRLDRRVRDVEVFWAERGLPYVAVSAMVDA